MFYQISNRGRPWQQHIRVNAFAEPFIWRRRERPKPWNIAIAGRAARGLGECFHALETGGRADHQGQGPARYISKDRNQPATILPQVRRTSYDHASHVRTGRHILGVSPGVHVNYAETVLPMRDGLPKLKDFPKEFSGSGEIIPE